MLFRRIIFSAVIIGIISGILLSTTQIVAVTPILLAAEEFEVSTPTEEVVDHSMHGDMDANDHHQHQHGEADDWAPSNGSERTSYTVMANISVAIGFAAILLVFISHFKSINRVQLSYKQGLLWGLACYFVFFILPSFGLPPEIPGSKADALKNRQSWWMLAVICAALGLLVMTFAKNKYKPLGIIALCLPFLVGAPHLAGPTFNHPDPESVATLNNLHQQFIVATSVSNLFFWLVLSGLSMWLLKVWIYKEDTAQSQAKNAQ